MKRTVIFLSLFALLLSTNENVKASEQNKLKRYEVKSGIVQYKITTSGKVLGSTVTGSGTESLYFKDWGAIELVEEISTQTTNTKIFGRKSSETTNVHTINKLDNGKSYFVDFDRNEIALRRDMAMDMTTAFHPDGDAGDVGKSMLESMGGEKIGNEKFLGYDCEIWDLMGTKQWMYKGVTLKTEVSMLGIKTVKEATSATFNESVASKHFELPDFPVTKEEGFLDDDEFEEDMEDMDEKMDKLSKMSYEEWKAMAVANDEELKQMSDAELRQTYDMFQKMIKMRSGK
jgi:hypothetical protein